MSAIESLRSSFALQGCNGRTASLFHRIIYDYYQLNRRALLWRETIDPYAILVSEIMLQQTQVERVKGKYREFIAIFPDFRTLAAAPLAEVLTAWQGLGYNRRAISLKATAEMVVGNFGGALPSSPDELECLPGIGHYTARAVAAFAFHRTEVFIETNIRAVFIHLFFPERLNVHDREILPLVEATLDRDNVREWYYALMDYGVFLKREHANPARKSAHHVRQAPFKGSNRELRSMILRKILDSPGVTVQQIVAGLGREDELVRKNLDALVKEGFIVVDQNNGYTVP